MSDHDGAVATPPACAAPADSDVAPVDLNATAFPAAADLNSSDAAAAAPPPPATPAQALVTAASGAELAHLGGASPETLRSWVLLRSLYQQALSESQVALHERSDGLARAAAAFAETRSLQHELAEAVDQATRLRGDCSDLRRERRELTATLKQRDAEIAEYKRLTSLLTERVESYEERFTVEELRRQEDAQRSRDDDAARRAGTTVLSQRALGALVDVLHHLEQAHAQLASATRTDDDRSGEDTQAATTSAAALRDAMGDASHDVLVQRCVDAARRLPCAVAACTGHDARATSHAETLRLEAAAAHGRCDELQASCRSLQAALAAAHAKLNAADDERAGDTEQLAAARQSLRDDVLERLGRVRRSIARLDNETADTSVPSAAVAADTTLLNAFEAVHAAATHARVHTAELEQHVLELRDCNITLTARCEASHAAVADAQAQAERLEHALRERPALHECADAATATLPVATCDTGVTTLPLALAPIVASAVQTTNADGNEWVRPIPPPRELPPEDEDRVLRATRAADHAAAIAGVFAVALADGVTAATAVAARLAVQRVVAAGGHTASAPRVLRGASRLRAVASAVVAMQRLQRAAAATRCDTDGGHVKAAGTMRTLARALDRYLDAALQQPTAAEAASLRAARVAALVRRLISLRDRRDDAREAVSMLVAQVSGVEDVAVQQQGVQVLRAVLVGHQQRTASVVDVRPAHPPASSPLGVAVSVVPDLVVRPGTPPQACSGVAPPRVALGEQPTNNNTAGQKPPTAVTTTPEQPVVLGFTRGSVSPGISTERGQRVIHEGVSPQASRSTSIHSNATTTAAVPLAPRSASAISTVSTATTPTGRRLRAGLTLGDVAKAAAAIAEGRPIAAGLLESSQTDDDGEPPCHNNSMPPLPPKSVAGHHHHHHHHHLHASWESTTRTHDASLASCHMSTGSSRSVTPDAERAATAYDLRQQHHALDVSNEILHAIEALGRSVDGALDRSARRQRGPATAA